MGLMKKLTSAIVASSLVLGLVGTAAADFSPAGVNEAAARMKALGVVKGVETPTGPDLMLNKPITRAELVTIIVRAFGKEDLAKLLKGSPAFSDSANHWASGEIAMAKNIIESKGHTLGVTPTTFVPNKEVSSAEAIAFVMKFLGVKENSTLSWPMNFIQGAVDAGLITEADKATLSVAPNSPAIRGLVFYLADHAFSSYKLADTGKSVYTSYVDTAAPVVSVDKFEATTEAETVTLTGKVSGHKVLHVSTTAGNTAAAVEADLDGTWSATLNLKVGDNTVWVHAVDIAGNVAMAEGVTITRVAGAAATVEATDLTVAAGQSVDVNAIVKDAKGNVVANPALTGDAGELGTFADGKFTAGTKAGEGTLTLTVGEISTVVNVKVTAGALADLSLTTDPAATTVAVGTPLKLVTTGVDAYGNTVEVTGVTYTASNGIVDAAGNFAATVAGASKVTATAGGMTKELTINVYSSASKLAVSNTKDIVRNGKSSDTITVYVQDANGFTVSSYNENVTLTVVGQTPDLVIMDGATAKGDTYTVKAVNGVATFTLKSEAAGTANATGRIQATSGTLTGALKEIALVKPALSSFKASVDVAQIEATPAAGATVTVEAYDQENVNVGPSAGYTLTFSSSNTDVLKISGAVNNSFDLAISAGEKSDTFNVLATNVPGSANLTATVKDANGAVVSIPVNTLTVNSAIATAVSKLQVIDGDALSMKAHGTTAPSVTFKVAALDQAGNVKSSINTAGAFPVFALSIKDSNGTDQAGKFDITYDAVANGIRTVKVAVKAAATKNAGTYTIATTNSLDLTNTSGSLTVTPAAAEKVMFTADNIRVAGDGISKVVLTAKVVDNRQNTVSWNGDVTLKQAKDASGQTADGLANFVMPSTAKIAAVNGVATWTLTASNTFGFDEFTLEGNLADPTGTAGALTMVDANAGAITNLQLRTVIAGAATKLGIASTTYGVSNLGATAGNTWTPQAANVLSTKKAGESYEIKVSVLDSQATPEVVTSDNGRPVTLVIKSGTGTVETATVNTVNGVATFKLSSTKGGTSATAFTSNVVVYAEAGGLTKSADATSYFRSAEKSKIVLAPASTNLQAGSNTNVTAKFVDTYGNFVAGTFNATGTFTAAAPDLKSIAISGSAATVASATNNTGSFVLTAGNFPASGQLTAAENADPAVPVDGAAITVYNAGLAYKASLQTIADVAADVTGGKITAKVQLTDYNGLLLTGAELATNELNKVPFALKVTDPSGGVTLFNGTTNSATSFVDGVVTYDYSMPATKNAGTYKFEIVLYPQADASALPADDVVDLEDMGYSAELRALYNGLKTSTVNVTVLPAAASAANLAALLPTGGESGATFDFDKATDATATPPYQQVSVAFLKVAAVDSKGNVATNFNGTAKVKLNTGASNLTLVGANSSGEVTVAITNGYGTVQVQRALDAATSGSLTTTITIDGVDQTSTLTMN